MPKLLGTEQKQYRLAIVYWRSKGSRKQITCSKLKIRKRGGGIIISDSRRVELAAERQFEENTYINEDAAFLQERKIESADLRKIALTSKVLCKQKGSCEIVIAWRPMQSQLPKGSQVTERYSKMFLARGLKSITEARIETR